MNLQQLTYRQKNYYLIIGALLFLGVIYFFSIRNTVEIYRKNEEIEVKLSKAEEAPKQVELLQNRLVQLNKSFSVYISDSLHNQDRILESVSSFCQKNNLILTELPLTSITEEEGFIVETNKTIAEGNFANLLKLLYELEYKTRVARISSASFNSHFDNRTKKMVLTLTIYLQNIKIKNSTL